MSYVRVLRTARVVLTREFYVDGVLTPTDATPVVTVKRLDGTVVGGAGAVGNPSPGVYTCAMPTSTDVDLWTVDWVGTIAGASTTFRDYVEVVGGFIFGLAEARAQRPLLSTAQWSEALLARKRLSVEQECERICGYAFVPRFVRVATTGRGTDTLVLPLIYGRTIRAATVDGSAVTGLKITESGLVTGTDFGDGLPVILEVEHGLDYPPEPIKDACMLRLRSRLHEVDTDVPHRALSFTVQAGGTYRLSTPSRERTGIPDVDAAYERETIEMGGWA